MLSLITLDAVGVYPGKEAPPVPLEPKRLALLVYLALWNGGRSISRDSILPVFWPDLGEHAARSALRQALHYLARRLGPVIEGLGTNDIAVDAGELRADVLAFEHALDMHETARGLRLYRGDFLAGFSFPSASDMFLEWVDRERVRLTERALEASILLAEDEGRRGNATGRVRWLKRALELEPFREDLLVEIIEVYQRAGQPATAAQTIRAFSRNLRLRYGVPPSPQIRQLLKSLVNWAPPDDHDDHEQRLHRLESLQSKVASEVARTTALVRQLQALPRGWRNGD